MTKPETRKSASTRLTDTQLIVLSHATQREDGAATAPEGMKDKAAQKLAATLIEKGVLREARAKSGMPVWRRSEEGGSFSLIITKLGRSTIRVQVADEDETNGADDAAIRSPKKGAASASLNSKVPTPRQGSKLAEAIALLSRKGGAGIEELIAATGWLPHTTRAALTGLRKRGYGVERSRPEGTKGSIYRIVQAPSQSVAA